ncbi:MAG: hypothetical protein MRZ98_03810, partial [Clostridiales bacterium]|nr:hypothetical protein [Clostridiales bacterium]
RGRSPSDWIRIERLTCGHRMKPFHLLCAAPGRAGSFRLCRKHSSSPSSEKIVVRRAFLTA